MSVDNFINGIERNIFSSKFDSTRLEKWKIKLTDVFQSSADYKKLMECLMKYIEYVINYGCSINNQKDQIAICRKYLGVVEVVVISREYQNVFIQELSHKVFDIVIEEDANSWCIKKELLKVFTKCARKVDKPVRQKTILGLPRIYLFKLFDSISTYSDYDLQVLLIETLFCMYGKDIITSKLKDLIPESEDLSQNFSSINLDMFYESVRKFLNVLNKASMKIFSIQCCNIKLGNFICVQSTNELDGSWVNFNLWNNSVSWHCCESTFDPGHEYDDDDPPNYILLFGSDVKTVMIDSSSDRTGLVVSFKLKNPCICSYEKIQNYVDKCDSCYMLLNDTEESRKLVSEILPQIFRKKIVQDGIEQKKVLKNIKGDLKPLKISKSKNMSNISGTTNWFCLSTTTSPSSKNDVLFKDDVVVVADTSLTHTESEDFLVEKSQDQYRTSSNEMGDDIISLHSSLSNELFSIHDEMERIQILSGRCSQSNVNVLPLIRNQSKGVSRFSRTITNRMEDIVEENETQFQTARETIMEVFQTADDMIHSQVAEFKASKAIHEDVESFNSLKVNIFTDRSSQPISQSGKMMENVDIESNKQESEKDTTINSQTYQAPDIKVSKNTCQDNHLNEAEIKSKKTTKEKTEKLSGRTEITDKCPKVLMQNEGLLDKVSRSIKEDDNTIETVRAKNKSLEEESVPLTTRGESQCPSEDVAHANSLIHKKKVSKFLISGETFHTSMDVHLRLTKKNEEITVSKKNFVSKKKDYNEEDDLPIDLEHCEKVLVEKTYHHISVQKNNNLKKQTLPTETTVHSQNVDKDNTDEISNKSYQKSENKFQTVEANEEMHCSKLIEDGVSGFENAEEEQFDEMTAKNQYLKFKKRVQSTKTVEEINSSKLVEDRVDGVEGRKKEKTEQMKKGSYRKPNKNIVPAETVEEINSPNWVDHNDFSLKSTDNDLTNNYSHKRHHKFKKMLQLVETREEMNDSKLIKHRSDGFESIKKEQYDPKQYDPIAVKGCYRRAKKLRQADIVREMNSAKLTEEEITDSPKGIKDSGDSSVSLENVKSDQITNKCGNLKSNKDIYLTEIIEETDSSEFVKDNVGGFESADKDKTDQIVDKSCFQKIINEIQPGESGNKMDSPMSNGGAAGEFDSKDKYNTNEIDDKTVKEINSPKSIKRITGGFASVEKEKTDVFPDNSQYQKLKKRLPPAKTNEELHSPKLIKYGFGSIEKEQLFDQITEKSRCGKTKNKIQPAKAVGEINPSKLIEYDACSLESTGKDIITDQTPYKTRYKKSKNMAQLAEANKEMDSQKSKQNSSDSFDSTKKVRPNQIVDKNLCSKSKKIQLVGTAEEMHSTKLIKYNSEGFGSTEKEQLFDQIAEKSRYRKTKNKIHPAETVEEMNTSKLIEYDVCRLESLEKDIPDQTSYKTRYQKSKNMLQLADKIKEMDSPKSIKDRSDGFESRKKNRPDKNVDKSLCRKSKKIQLVGTAEEMNSPKLIKDSGLGSAEKEKTDQIANNSLNGKTKFQQERTDLIPDEHQESKNIQLTETVKEIDSLKIIENNARNSEILEKGGTQISIKSQYKKSNKAIQPSETFEGKESQVLVKDKADDLGSSEKLEIQHVPDKIAYEKLKQIELSENQEIGYLKTIEDNADEFEEMQTNQVSNSSRCRSKNIYQAKTDHIVSEEKSSIGNKIDVERSLKKSFEIKGIKDIVIPLIAIKIGTHQSIVTREKELIEDSQCSEHNSQASSKSSRRCINRCLAKVEDSSMSSKENECPNIKHQTSENKSKLIKKRQLICSLEEIVINTNERSTEQNGILNEVAIDIEKNPIQNKHVCEQIPISKKNVLAGSPNLFEDVPKENTILTKDFLRNISNSDVPTESLHEDILEGNPTLDKNIVQKGLLQEILTETQVSSKYDGRDLDIIDNVSKSTVVPEKNSFSNDVLEHKFPQGILTETSNPSKDIQRKSTVSNKCLTKQENQTANDDVPLEDILTKYDSKQNQILVSKQLLSNNKLSPEKDVVFNTLLDDYKNELQNITQFKNNVGDIDNKVATKIHNKPINPEITKVDKGKEGQMDVAEESVDAIQQFIEASFDRSTKDSNQTLSTTISGKRKLRKLYTPGDLSFIDILKKRPVVVTEINKKSSIVENKAVEVKTVAVDSSLSSKPEITVLGEQLTHVTKSTCKKRKLAQTEAKQLQPIEECVKIKKNKTFLDEEVDRSRKNASKKQKVTQSKMEQSKLGEKHNITEEKRARLQSSFTNMLKSLRQEMGITSVIEYVHKPKIQDKRRTRGKPPAHITKSKCNNRKFSVDRVMRTEKLDLSDSSSSSMDLRAPKKIARQLAPTPPTPLPDPPEAIPVVPIETDTKKIHVISDLLLVPGPIPKKRQRLMSVVESTRVEGDATVHMEPELVNNRDEDLISIPADNYSLVSHLAPDWRGTALVDRDYMSIGSKDYLGKYLILFFYPLDFGRSEIHEPTDVIALSKKAVVFRNLNCEMVACSVDHYWTHLAWNNQLEGGINFPLLADPTHAISNAFGVYMKDTGYTYRSCFLINPKGIINWQETIGVQYEMNIERILQIVQYVLSRDT